MKLFFSLFVSAIALFASGDVTVSILPQKYFVEKITGDTVHVNVMVLPGNSPATYEPKPSQMAQLEKSDLYFAIGVPYELHWLPKFNKQYPSLPIVFTQKGIKKIEMEAHHHHGEEHAEHDHEHEEHAEHKHEHEEHAKHDHDHDHEKHADHDHEKSEKKEFCHYGHCHPVGMLDPHVWLDPILVKTQAKNIEKALSRKYPKNKALYAKNLKIFLAELDAFDKTLAKKLKNVKNRKFMVYHPAWGYFAKRYGLIQEAAELEGKEPKPKELQELIEEAKEDGIKVIFVQPQFSKKSAKLIADAIGGKVVSINPLEEDWKQGLLDTADVFLEHSK